MAVLILIPFSSAEFFSDAWGKITGKAAQSVSVNVTVGVPEIREVFNDTASIIAAGTGLSSGPVNTSLIVNFSVYDANGASNLSTRIIPCGSSTIIVDFLNPPILSFRTQIEGKEHRKLFTLR